MSVAIPLNYIACDEIAQERYGEVLITGLREVLFKCSFCLQTFYHYDKFLEHIFAHYDADFLSELPYNVKDDLPDNVAPIPRDIITKPTVPPTTLSPVEPSPEMPNIKFIPLKQDKALEGLKRSYASNVFRMPFKSQSLDSVIINSLEDKYEKPKQIVTVRVTKKDLGPKLPVIKEPQMLLNLQAEKEPKLPASNFLKFVPIHSEEHRETPVVISPTSFISIEEQPEEVEAPPVIATPASLITIAEQPLEMLPNSALNAQTPLTMMGNEPVLATPIYNESPTDAILTTSLQRLEDNKSISNTTTPSTTPQQRRSPKEEPHIPRSTIKNSSKWREGWFKCDICPGVYNTAGALLNHRRRHLGDARYRCRHCEMKFYSGSVRDTHEARHTDADYAHKCQYCGVGYDTEAFVARHELRHRVHNVANGKCANAGTPINKENAFEQRATNADIAIARKRKQRSDRKEFRGYTCCICGAWFESLNERKSHERETHLGTDKYKCKYCDNTFKTTEERQIHEGDEFYLSLADIEANEEEQKNKQLENNLYRIDLNAGIDQPDPLEISPTAALLDKYPCRLCDRLFKYEFTLAEHYIRIHKFKGNYKCAFCDEEFNRQSGKIMHENAVHCNVISYICKYCGKGITNQYSLKRHEKHHEVIKTKVKCSKCEKTLPRIRLKAHMLSHNNERPFKCKYCHRTFRLKHHMTRHEQIHENKRAHKCDICGKGFNLRDDMKQHRKKCQRRLLRRQLKGESKKQKQENEK